MLPRRWLSSSLTSFFKMMVGMRVTPTTKVRQTVMVTVSIPMASKMVIMGEIKAPNPKPMAMTMATRYRGTSPARLTITPFCWDIAKTTSPQTGPRGDPRLSLLYYPHYHSTNFD